MKIISKATIVNKDHRESYDTEFKQKIEIYTINVWHEDTSMYTEIHLSKDQYAELEVGTKLRFTIEKD